MEESDKAAAAVATHPRVTLADIHNNIAAEYSFTLDKAVGSVPSPAIARLDIVTVHVLVMKNGFMVMGKSAPASPENFNQELGVRFAREDALRQVWPLMAFVLRDRLMEAAAPRPRAFPAMDGQKPAEQAPAPIQQRPPTAAQTPARRGGETL